VNRYQSTRRHNPQDLSLQPHSYEALRLTTEITRHPLFPGSIYPGADKSLARPGRKQARKRVSDARDFNNTKTRAVIKFPSTLRQGKAPKEIHAILTETSLCFLPDRAKDLSAPLPYRKGRQSDWTTANVPVVHFVAPLPAGANTVIWQKRNINNIILPSVGEGLLDHLSLQLTF